MVWRIRVTININMSSKLAGTTMGKNLFWRSGGSEKSRLGLDVSNSILCSSSGEWRRAGHTVWNVETKPALFRANTPSKEILLMVVPASLLLILIFIVTLTVTMNCFSLCNSWVVLIVVQKRQSYILVSDKISKQGLSVAYKWSVSRQEGRMILIFFFYVEICLWLGW